MNTDIILEFDKIKTKLSELSYTEKAKVEIQNLKPFLSVAEVNVRLRETTEAKDMVQKCGNPPAATLTGIDSLMETATKGGCLSPQQLEEVRSALTSVRRMKDYLNRCKQFQIGLAFYEENLDSLDDICEELNLKIRGGQVDDYASKTLKTIRDSIERTDSKMHDKAEVAIRANKAYVSENFSTLRNGHICIPVKKEYKYKVSGSVMDKSSTGSTLFIEPAAVATLYDELQELRIDEENEVIRILYTLSGMLSDKEETMHQNSRTIEKLDFIFAKAKLSIEYEGVQPIINTSRYIRFKNARHPLMDKHINIPLNFEIGDGVRGVIITGPNTGGKTVAIKTVALNCLMAQCGLHTACEEAEICMSNAILCDIGDGQNLSENLSTFSAHITNVLDILKCANHESLVIMDELGSGTDPAEGMGIAIAILDELKKSGALFLVTTHYPEVKEYAAHEQEIINARMTFDKESLKPLYQLVIGEAGESCAFYIAGKLGMPRHMLEKAAVAAYGEDAVEKIEGITVNAGTSETDSCASNARNTHPKIQKQKQTVKQAEALKYQLGDSVMVMPDKKVGIVCQTADEKGVLRVQMQNKKIWINHKRVRLHVPAEQLYPEDYDFSIIFNSASERKMRHNMDRKYVEETLICEE